MNLYLKTKEELTEELKEQGYYYKFVFGNISFEEKKLVYKALKEDNFFETMSTIDEFTLIDEDYFDHISTIFFDKNDNVVAVTFLEEIQIPDCFSNFYSIFGYQVTKNRKSTFRFSKASIVMKTMFSITYYESSSYASINNSKIDGLIYIISNKKIQKWFKNKKIVYDGGYHLMFYLTQYVNEEIGLNKPAYILYYPTSKINV